MVNFKIYLGAVFSKPTLQLKLLSVNNTLGSNTNLLAFEIDGNPNNTISKVIKENIEFLNLLDKHELKPADPIAEVLLADLKGTFNQQDSVMEDIKEIPKLSKMFTFSELNTDYSVMEPAFLKLIARDTIIAETIKLALACKHINKVLAVANTKKARSINTIIPKKNIVQKEPVYGGSYGDLKSIGLNLSKPIARLKKAPTKLKEVINEYKEMINETNSYYTTGSSIPKASSNFVDAAKSSNYTPPEPSWFEDEPAVVHSHVKF